MQLEELIVPLKLNDESFDSGIERAITRASAFGTFIGNIATSAVSGAFNLLGGAIDKVGGFLASSVNEASEAQNGLAQLEAVLKSTGGAAGVTSEQAQDLASSLQKVTRFSDDAILSGENMLLTFTSIGKEIFPRATETILDMSQALNQDLKSSAIQLGKALNDPIAGVSALRRVGVQFSDEQEEMIKKMVESGDLMKAQTFILDELQKEFGGSAEAAGKTFGGQLDILKNKLSDLKERIGNAILPILGSLTDRFNKIIDSPQFQSIIDTVVGKLEELSTWIQTNLPKWEEKFKGWLDGAKKAGEGIATTWKEHVFPVAEQLIRLYNNINGILERLDPSTEKLAGKFTLLGIIQRESVAIATLVNGALQITAGILNIVNTMIERGIAKWDRFKNVIYAVITALARLSIPWWLTPGSPTPLENGLRGIDDALTSLNNKALPQFESGLNVNATLSGNSIDYNRLAKVLAVEVAKVLV